MFIRGERSVKIPAWAAAQQEEDEHTEGEVGLGTGGIWEKKG